MYAFVTVLTSIATVARSQSAPNIIVIDIDDLPFLQQWRNYAPEGTELENGVSVDYEFIPVPNMGAFLGESVVFSKAYCGGPKCAPSRYSLLTGRQPTRSEEAVRKTLEEDSSSDSGIYGPKVTVPYTRIADDDKRFNLPTLLQKHKSSPYYTGCVGKWHLMGDEDEESYFCGELDTTPDRVMYEQCADLVKEVGFDFVDALYVGNIGTNDYFSHNPEWMVSQAQRFIAQAVNVEQKSFFLYFAPTLTHTVGSQNIEDVLLNTDTSMTPKGILVDDELPNDVNMKSRQEIWQAAQDKTDDMDSARVAAPLIWIDDAFGALMGFVDDMGLKDNTLVVVMGDHGLFAKGTVYEQGSRILMMMRYPPLFGTQKVEMPSEFVVSAMDVPPTIFDLVGKNLPGKYVMDGVSLLDGVVDYIASGQKVLDNSCCESRVVDILHSHSIVTGSFQYIWRATDEVEDEDGQDLLYPNSHDLEQLYDLNADPNEKVNRITDESLKDTIHAMETQMRKYVEDICPTTSKACVMPAMRCWNDAECDAAAGEICRDGACGVHSLCADGCESFEFCDGRVCAMAVECATDEHCSGTKECVNNECVKPCVDDDGCTTGGRTCIGGYCAFAP